MLVVFLASTCKRGKWLKNLLFEILLWQKPIPEIYVQCDNAATLANVYNQIYNGKSRHIGLRHLCETTHY